MGQYLEINQAITSLLLTKKTEKYFNFSFYKPIVEEFLRYSGSEHKDDIRCEPQNKKLADGRSGKKSETERDTTVSIPTTYRCMDEEQQLQPMKQRNISVSHAEGSSHLKNHESPVDCDVLAFKVDVEGDLNG